MSTSEPLSTTELIVLFTDIADSSGLYERIGNEAAFDRIDRRLKGMQRIVEHSGGRVVKLTGDGLMAVFGQADAALDACSTMSMDIGDFPMCGEPVLDIRMGFHSGPVVRAADDLFGETVNVAARLCELAASGTALTTAETAGLLSRSRYRRLRPIPPRPLKGISRSFDLLELVCSDVNAVTAVFGGLDSAFTPATLELTFRGEVRIMDEGVHRLAIGREPGADIVLVNTHASRRQCVIEERGGKFVLIDASSNGTYVVEDGGRSLRLRREELVLSGRGWITFGRPRGKGVEEMEFNCLG